jgi:hypothetical protein
MIIFLVWWFTFLEVTIWLFNIAMEHGPFIDGLPIKNGDFPWLRQYFWWLSPHVGRRRARRAGASVLCETSMDRSAKQ